ncbi:MAG: YidC/Oxa1 family membrane protein insertase [Eubacterium sp.]
MAATVSNGIGIFKPLYWLFGKCMEGLLFVFNDRYFLALIVFTILTRLVLFPFNIKQQKTMAKTTRLQPKIQKIQKKYAYNGNDPKERQRMQSKMNEEMQNLYAREGHNPMNMGCGPMMFQMVFLMGIIGIIYYPLQYIIGIPISDYTDQIAKAINFEGQYFQIEILQNFPEIKGTLMTQFPDLFTADKVAEIENYRQSLQLGTLDMTAIPHWKDGIIVIIPIFCLLTSLGSSLLSTLIQKKNNPAAAQQQSQMMIMMLMMPFFSFYISFKVSAAVGFYWIISNVVAMVQQLVMAKFFPPKRNQAREMIENTINRRAREESIRKIK